MCGNKSDMKKYIVSGISNLLFLNFCIFVLTALFSASIFTAPINLIFSGLITIITLYVSAIILKHKLKKKKISSERKAKINELTYALNISTKKSGLNALYGAFSKKQDGCKLLQDKIVLKSGDKVFNCFGFDGITKKDVVKCYNLSTTSTCILACDYAPKEVKEFVALFKGKVKILEKQELFREINPYDIDLCVNLPLDFSLKQKPNFRILLNRKNAKRFLAFGLFFSLMSFFVPIKIYYLIMGGVFIIYSLILFFFGK